MKVAIVAQPNDGVLPPNQNSLGLIAYNTAIEMARHINVTLYAKQRPGIESPDNLPFNVAFIASRSDDVIQQIATHYPRWAHRFGISTLADAYINYANSVANALNRAGHDIVHLMNYWSWCRRLRERKHRRLLVLEMQSEWLSQMDAGKVSTALEATDAIVAVSDHIARLFRASFPAYEGPVYTAYNGVNIDTFRPGPKRDAQSNGDLTVLFVGRVSPEKGIHTLIEAFAQISSCIDKARLVIAGPRTTLRKDFIVGISSDPLVQALDRFYTDSAGDAYQRHLDSIVARWKLGNKVRFLGSVPHKELIDLYKSSDIVVNPSLSESFGISIVEGMACSLPVVGTKVGGMLETILDGETGMLVEPERPDLLAKAILSILQDSESAHRMGAKGRVHTVENFSWHARADRLLSAYKKILEQRRA